MLPDTQKLQEGEGRIGKDYGEYQLGQTPTI
jgi:hypothetical protein